MGVDDMWVRRQTFEAVVAGVTLLDLPVVFEGSRLEVAAFGNSQPGFVWKDAPRMLFGGYWYNRVEAVALLPG
jgi:hypothetical protein